MAVSTLSARSGSALGAFFSRLYVEAEAFFEEALAAVARSEKEQPFGA